MRRRSALGLVALGVLVVWWLTTRARDPAFTVVVVASQGQTVPWHLVTLEARVTPATARAKNAAAWHWSWKASGGSLHGDGERAEFVAERDGVYVVTVTARSPGGREQSADVQLLVRSRADLMSAPSTPGEERPSASRSDLPFEISEVTAEPTRICRGGESMIRMRGAHQDPSREALLYPVVTGSVGWTAPFRPVNRAPGRYPVDVFLFEEPDHPERFQTARVYVELGDCVAPWFLSLSQRDAFHVSPETYDFHAQLHPGQAWDQYTTTDLSRFAKGAPEATAPTAKAASYVWDFADGTSETTAVPTVRHSFPVEADRPAGELLHPYLVSVHARDSEGQTLATAASTVVLKNYYRELKLRGHRIQLETLRSPVGAADGHGNRTVEVTLVNGDSEETVTLDKLELTILSCAGQAVETVERPIIEVFPVAVLAPRQRVTGALSWPEGGANGPCNVKVVAHGATAPGSFEAIAFFDMSMGKPMHGDSLVADSDLLRRIQSLTSGQSTFGRADVERLEQEGRIPPGSWDQLQMKR